MRLDGGHPALDLVNTVYGQVGGPVEHDVLTEPPDLVVLAGRLGLADGRTPAGSSALRAARVLRGALDSLFRARLAGNPPPRPALDAVGSAVRAAHGEARLEPTGAGSLDWVWPDEDAQVPVHRLALAGLALLGDATELARLRCCAACRWLYLDHSRGAGRRWCSMADCGTEAKKRRYVQRRRDRRTIRRTP
jgi:predicted RNA-binding Zn ribbon-like protein